MPGTKLLLNDYNILQDNTVTTKYINLIDTLKVRALSTALEYKGTISNSEARSALPAMYTLEY